jgi:aspartyl-tRNA(Asn)/glutamyl-tRNA(Gln) amidotransferase subunit A
MRKRIIEVLKRIDEHAMTNAFISVERDVDSLLLRDGERGALSNMIVAVKDNLCTKSLPTTCASRSLSSHTSSFDAASVALVRRSGATVIGKTNMDEFGMGSACVHSHFGPTLNPHVPGLVAGGSSGGSAAAVALSLCDVALGTDTGGSCRLPAAYCGVVGFKPSYGIVSRWGLVAYASSLDTVGFIGTRVDDIRRVVDVAVGEHEHDSTSLGQARQRYLAAGAAGPLAAGDAPPLDGVRVGVPVEYRVAELGDEAVEQWQRAIDLLRSLGAHVGPVSLPNTRHALPAYYTIAAAEASSNLARYDGVRYGHRALAPLQCDDFLHYVRRNRTDAFGAEVQRRIVMGNYVLSHAAYQSHYVRAQRIRRLVSDDFRLAFANVDVLLTPTAPAPPPRIDDILRAADPVAAEYVNDVMTIPASLAGLPAIALPQRIASSSSSSSSSSSPWSSLSPVPSSVQLIANYACDRRLLSIAERIESLL